MTDIRNSPSGRLLSVESGGSVMFVRFYFTGMLTFPGAQRYASILGNTPFPYVANSLFSIGAQPIPSNGVLQRVFWEWQADNGTTSGDEVVCQMRRTSNPALVEPITPIGAAFTITAAEQNINNSRDVLENEAVSQGDILVCTITPPANYATTGAGAIILATVQIALE